MTRLTAHPSIPRLHPFERLAFALALGLPLFLLGCGTDQPDSTDRAVMEIPDREPEVRTVTDAEATADADRIRAGVPVTVADGLELSLWASDKLLGDPVGIHMDDRGRALVTVTTRSWSSEIDIRDAPEHWLMETIKLTSVEDRRAFLHRELATELSDSNTWIPDHNEDGSHDWRDLAVDAEEVWWVEDSSGDGRADRSTLFIRDFNDEVTDVAGAVTEHDGDVFLGVGPDMWRLRDVEDDGMADSKESISHGYNVHVGFSGHGMSGAVMGPDGRLYWGIGDMGLDVVDREGQRWSSPHKGAILRSEPDGTGFEIFASGVRNTHVFVFDEYGNLISVDNDGDHPGEMERLVYLPNGSDSGWRINWQFGKYADPENNAYHVWMDEEYFVPRFDDQAAHLLPPIANYHSGPAGMAYNPGTAMSEAWRNHFFIMSYRGSPQSSALYGFTLEQDGAGFDLSTDEEVLRGILPVGIGFGPDGALYLTDWVAGWTPRGDGRIWTLDSPAGRGSDARLETQRILGQDFSSLELDELDSHLGHADMRVRQKAQFELVGRGELEVLRAAIDPARDQLTRIHGVWGLAQAGRQDPEAVAPLVDLLDDADPEIRAQAAKMLGDVRYEPAAERIVPLLSDANPRARYFAAEAVGRIGYRPGLGAVVEMLRANDDEDVLLRHGGAIALARLEDPAAVAALADDPSRAVRVAAVVALRRMEAPEVARFLDDEDEYVVTNAARAISDDAMIEEALPALARMLEQDRFTNEPLIRRAINANLYVGGAEAAERLAAYALRSGPDESLRTEALWTLAGWTASSEFDRVTGMYRGQVENDAAVARTALGPLVERLADLPGDEFTIAAIEAMANLQMTSAVPAIRTLFDRSDDAEVRRVALVALRDLDYAEMGEVVSGALDSSDSAVRMEALGMMGELEISDEVAAGLLAAVLEEGDVTERQTAYRLLGETGTEEAGEVLATHLARLVAGDVAPEVQLDLILAAETLGTEPLSTALAEYRSGWPADDPLAEFRPSLQGGDDDRGEAIFERTTAAQCTRCHVIGEEPGEGTTAVGPDLDGVATRLTREDLLMAMIDPSAQLAPGFEAGGVSAMPPMGVALSRSQIRDLVEYLSTLD